MEKTCKICGKLKDIMEFHKKKTSPLGCRNECKDCVNEMQRKKQKTPEDKEKHKIYLKEWRKNHKEYYKSLKRKEYKNKWREDNKEKIAEQSRNYVRKHSKHLREIEKEKRKIRYINNLNNPLFRLKESVRCSVRRSIKYMGYSKKNNTEMILGCSYLEFKIHLESQFEDWMNYDNYGKYNGEFNYGWDIDHIIPISTATTEEEVIKLNHYTNLRPLCSKMNRDIKKNKIQPNK